MTTSSSNVDATTNLEKILATGRYRDGSPGRNVFLQISTGLPYQSARANTYWWLWLPIFNVCWRKQSTFPGRIPAQGLIIPEHWVHKLRWQWALRRWNWTRCEKIRHKEAGLGGTKVESTQGRPWHCPQKIIKAPCQKFPDRKSCWQEILFTRPPFSGYKHTCTGKIVIWKCPCRYERAGTLILHLQFKHISLTYCASKFYEPHW